MNLKRFYLSIIVSFFGLCSFAGSPYSIYPVPQIQQVLPQTASFSQAVNIVAGKNINSVTVERAKEVLQNKGLAVRVSGKVSGSLSNVVLGVEGGKDIPNALAGKQKLPLTVLRTPGKFDRHVLSLYRSGNRANVIIIGENTDAVFCGLASFEQILDNGTQNLSCVLLQDYADIQYRGIIEGYYGVPYNEDVTKELFRFMARYKMNSYMYGAKSDPYHSQKWAEAYPDSITAEQKAMGLLSKKMMKDITAEARKNNVNFIWAIHPGTDFTENKENRVVERIMVKFEKMYGLGVRQFGVFVDDVGVPQDSISLALNAKHLSQVQQAVEMRWNKHYENPADTVKPIHFVPQLYAYSWFNDTVRHNFFTALSHTPKNVVVYITGAKIWSIPNSYDLAVVKKSFGRPLAWWWNYPCNDNDVSKLFVRDTYANFSDEKWIDNDARLEPDLQGATALISNPMQQGMASCFALFSIADYAWNHKTFDSEQSYQAAVRAVVGKQYAESFEYLSNYLRYYDAEPLASLVEDYKTSGDEQPLMAEMERLMVASDRFLAMASSPNKRDSIFAADVKPWVSKVSDMAFITYELLKQLKNKGNGNAVPPALQRKLTSLVTELDKNGKYNFPILTGMGNDISLKNIPAEPAQKVFRPFMDYLLKQLAQ